MSLEDSLVKLAVTGDREAQRLIYDSLKGSVCRLVARIVALSDVDDVTQDVFLHVFSALSTFRFESQFSTWVYRLAVNDALQHLRRQRRREMVPLDNLEIPEPVLQPDVENNEMLSLAISKLEPELRVILHLKEEQEVDYATIAEILRIPEGTVGSRLNRARRELKKELLALGWGN
ncbi:MAG: sigma-70 family RNA polymerase sigma factor [Planctomyces sp.]|nr:sigma-70 family RNA polymerase sigma factor [Planctomyces sp.]